MPSTSLSSSKRPTPTPSRRRNHLLRARTNAVALLRQHEPVGTADSRRGFHELRVHLEDLANSRPARLDLTDIALSVKNISNVPATIYPPRFAALEHQRHDQHRIAHPFRRPPPTSISRSQTSTRHARSVSRTKVNAHLDSKLG